MTSWFWRLLRGLLFRMDAETSHRSVLRILHALSRLPRPVRVVPLAMVAPSTVGVSKRGTSADCEVFGLRFANPVGLAGGFDKDAEILTILPDLGFGFAEIGTVTPRPQPGNDRPRLFRDPTRASLFNRMGFCGLGATIVSDRLARARERLPRDFRVGVNIGKNKETPLEQASEDYRKAIEPFRDLADYVVINVSSPNTPGLRSLQSVKALRPILTTVADSTGRWRRPPPILLKLAPELSGIELAELVLKMEAGDDGCPPVDGWVLTNTLAGEIEARGTKVEGGWSGSALVEASRRSLKEVRSQSRKPIISVGGIQSEGEARTRIQMGANLIQIYTGWIYAGPGLPAKLARSLTHLS